MGMEIAWVLLPNTTQAYEEGRVDAGDDLEVQPSLPPMAQSVTLSMALHSPMSCESVWVVWDGVEYVTINHVYQNVTNHSTSCKRAASCSPLLPLHQDSPSGPRDWQETTCTACNAVQQLMSCQCRILNCWLIHMSAVL